MLEFERKFIDTIEINDEWEIETDNGWSPINKIGKTIKYNEWVIKTNSFELICADTHIVFNSKFKEVFVKDLKVGDKILTKNGIESVISVYMTDIESNMYDLELNDDNHRLYTNGILSHNSMWMHNIASNAIKTGFNVVVITLEMASYKCIKRMGSMLLNIHPDLYEEKSKDEQYMLNKINSFRASGNDTSLFGGQTGELWVKKYNTSDCTVTDIDNYLTKLKERKNIRIDMVLVDYINIMSVEKGINLQGNLYQKGKHLAEGLRYIADKHNVVMITATQTDRSVWGASDIKLDSIPESKAIAETADTVWAIIRTSEMQKQFLYRLKNLKLRDGECKEAQVVFNFHPENLTINNDHLVS
jgi:hypothetical protein